MSDYISERQKMGILLAQMREEAGMSQEEASSRVNVHRTTLMRWENGTSSPDVIQLIYYIERVLNKSLRQFMHSFKSRERVLISIDDLDARKELCEAVMYEMPILDVKELNYLWHGKHGSDPHAVTQLLTANIESPMQSRVLNATAVVTNYELAMHQGKVPEGAPAVDFESLLSATQAGKTAAIENKTAYYDK